MATFFVVLRRTGRQWRPGVELEAQLGFDAHAAYMDAACAAGTVVLGGPLEDDARVVLVLEAESRDDVVQLLEADPWHGSHLTTESIDRWTLRLDHPGISTR